MWYFFNLKNTYWYAMTVVCVLLKNALLYFQWCIFNDDLVLNILEYYGVYLYLNVNYASVLNSHFQFYETPIVLCTHILMRGYTGLPYNTPLRTYPLNSSNIVYIWSA